MTYYQGRQSIKTVDTVATLVSCGTACTGFDRIYALLLLLSYGAISNPVRPRLQEGLKLTLLITTHNLLHSLKITTRPLEQNFFLFTQPKAKATQSNTFQHKSCKLMQLISSHTTQCCKLLKQLMDQKHLIHPTHLVHLIGWFT